MGEHRRFRRARGVSVRTGDGRRRRSGLLEEPGSSRELNRSARKVARAAARRKILGAVVGAVLIVAAAVGLSIVLLRQAPDEGPQVTVPAETGLSALVVVTDSQGRASSVALIASGTDGPEVVLFPPSLLTVLPGFGTRELSDISRFPVDDLGELTIANLLGVRIDAAVTIDATTLMAAVASPVVVNLTTGVMIDDGGVQKVLVAAGDAARTPEELAAILTRKGSGTDLEWLDRQGAVWKALLGSGPTNQAVVNLLSGRMLGDPVLGAAAIAATAESDELPLTAIPVRRIERAGGDSELYQLSSSDADAFVAERLPFLRLREGPRPRVEILNGNGRIGTTRPVAAVLIAKGFHVVRTDNADRTDYEKTRVVAQGREHEQDALEARQILGRGEVLIEVRQPSGVVDLTIIVGQDIPAEEV